MLDALRSSVLFFKKPIAVDAWSLFDFKPVFNLRLDRVLDSPFGLSEIIDGVV